MLTKFLNPRNDVAFKKIFGTEQHKNILIRFINDMLEFQGDQKIQTVEFLPPVQDPDIAMYKQSIVDVLCKDAMGVTYIIEMQVARSEGFAKRAQYYAAKAYARQLERGKGGKYETLKEIIFIAITDFILFPDKAAYKSDHQILDKETYSHDLKDFYFTFLELPKFKKSKTESLANSIEQWCRFFKYAEETTELELDSITGQDIVVRQAYEAINQFNWTEAELDQYEQDIKRTWDQGAIFRAAIADATMIGEAKGKAEGAQDMKLKILKTMLQANMAVADIAKLMNSDIQEINHLIQFIEFKN
jgi:predicted transposase/invertase (TIGR01784 family)